ncbi:MAG: hypothetical protein ACSHXK_14580 [Oceanococcus sp.]
MNRHIVLILAAGGLLLCTGAQAEPKNREELQFQLNAKLAGRTLACGDRAGHASMRLASRQLASLLPSGGSLAEHMAAFDQRARLQRNFSNRAGDKHRACQRVSEQLEKNLGYTQLIAPTELPREPE